MAFAVQFRAVRFRGVRPNNRRLSAAEERYRRRAVDRSEVRDRRTGVRWQSDRPPRPADRLDVRGRVFRRLRVQRPSAIQFFPRSSAARIHGSGNAIVGGRRRRQSPPPLGLPKE